MKLIRKTKRLHIGSHRLHMMAAALFVLLTTNTIKAQTADGRDFGIDGFAAIAGTEGTPHYREGGTTGGEGGKVVYASTLQQLQAYLQAKAPYVIIVDHDMDTGIRCYVDDLSTGHLCDAQDGSQGVATTYGERIMVAPDKTLIGVADPTTGKAPLFSRITFVMQSVDNIIIRNCRFTMNGVPVLKSGENKIVAFRDGRQVEIGDPDCISIQADKSSAKTDWGAHIWIDHCEFFNGNAADKDRYDGLLDCKNNVQWMTFSYNHFHDHDKACLFGKGDSDIFDGCRTISMHHNWFDNIAGSRLPLQRGGYLHYYNNYMVGSEDGWDVRTKATGYVEACYFKDSKAPIRSDREGSLNINKSEGYDIIYENCRRLMEGYENIDKTKIDDVYSVNYTDWTPDMSASDYKVNHLDKTADVPAVVEKYAGAGKIEIYKTYTDAVPAEDMDEYAKAIKDEPTAGTYDTNGNRITEVITGIQDKTASRQAAVQYYSLNGERLASPAKGINIKKEINAAGNISTSKIIRK